MYIVPSNDNADVPNPDEATADPLEEAENIILLRLVHRR